jgi:hypothetical protein
LARWHPENAALFLTWRLHGSQPALSEFVVKPTESEGQRFVALDRQTDRAAACPIWLNECRIGG